MKKYIDVLGTMVCEKKELRLMEMVHKLTNGF